MFSLHDEDEIRTNLTTTATVTLTKRSKMLTQREGVSCRMLGVGIRTGGRGMVRVRVTVMVRMLVY